MNKATVLIDVVSIIENEMKETAIRTHKEMGFTGKDPNQRVRIESTTVATHASIELDVVIKVLNRLRDRFQEQIEAEISAFETSQGM